MRCALAGGAYGAIGPAEGSHGINADLRVREVSNSISEGLWFGIHSEIRIPQKPWLVKYIIAFGSVHSKELTDVFFVSADFKELRDKNWMPKQKRQQGCWRYRIRGEVLPKQQYTLVDTVCQEER